MDLYVTQEHPRGLTIKELREVLDGWAEENPEGEDCEVWIGDNESCTSRPALEIGPLNFRQEGNLRWADLIIS